MATFLFQEAETQYIDASGKARMINFPSRNLSLMTSPIPPMDMAEDKTVMEATLNDAIQFIKERGLQITSQDGNEEDGIQGVWVEMKEENPGIYYGYIPVEAGSKAIKNVEFTESTKNDPIRVNKTSELQIYRRNRRIADFLKQYTLFTYAKNPESFGRKSFVIIPDHHYDIESLNKRVYDEGNNVMYSKGRLIVQNKDIRDKLMYYLKMSLLNDTPGVMNTVNLATIEDYYRTVSDFRSTPSQLVFSNSTGVLRWKYSLKRQELSSNVLSDVDPDTREPYYYKTSGIRNGILFIMQNVEDGNLGDALRVSYKWVKDRVNKGYNPVEIASPEDITHIVYTNEGELSRHKGTTKEKAYVFLYENGTYAAILFLS